MSRGVSATANARPHIVFIVAVAENGVIGANGAMPWRLKSDLQRFKALTVGRPVVMGRTTFASIGQCRFRGRLWGDNDGS